MSAVERSHSLESSRNVVCEADIDMAEPVHTSAEGERKENDRNNMKSQSAEPVVCSHDQEAPNAARNTVEEVSGLSGLLSLSIFVIMAILVLYIITVRLVSPLVQHAFAFAAETLDRLHPKQPGQVQLVRVLTKPATIGSTISVEYEFRGEKADAVLFYLNDSVYIIHYFHKCRIPLTVAPNLAGVRHRMIFSFMALQKQMRIQAELVAAEQCGDSANWKTISRSVPATIHAFSADGEPQRAPK